MKSDWSDEKEKIELEKRQREREKRFLNYLQRRHKSEGR
jgi:hypothetical protein